MKRTLILVLTALTLLLSCDIFTPESRNDRKTYLVAVGLDYRMNRRITPLDNTCNDFRGIVEQFQTLSELSGNPYEITTYSDFSSEDGRIIFSFDHQTSGLKEEPIFNPETEVMRNSDEFIIRGETKEEITDSFLEGLRNTFESVSTPKKDDLIIFYFTGHGTEKGGPVIHHSNEGRTYTAISYRELEEKFLSLYGCRTISIIDCCYSGASITDSELGSTIGFNEGKDEDGNSDERKKRHSITDALSNGFRSSFTESNPDPRHVYMSASTARQKSYEYDIYQNGWNSEKYGAFTYQVLRSWGYDTDNMEPAFPMEFIGKTLTLGDVYSFIRDNMSRGNRERSTPTLTRSRYDVTIFDFRK